MSIKKSIGIIVLLLGFVSAKSQDLQIQDLTWNVSGDSIFNDIASLSELERFTYNNDSNTVEYIVSHFEALNFDTLYTEVWETSALPNIVIEKTGLVYPDSVIILGAHYDSYSTGAPGADDNASGTSGVMEVARVLSESNFEFTIRFVLFSGEELGLLGSEYHASQTFLSDKNVKLMVNLDMISYVYEGGEPTINIIYDQSSGFLYDNYVGVINNYIPGFQYNDASMSNLAGASDHRSFWDQGYSAMFLIDCSDFSSVDFNHFIHSDDDVIGISANSQYLAESIVKTVVVSLCEYAVLTDEFQYINSVVRESDIRIFPNPTDDIVYLQFNDILEQEVLVQIISSTGTLIEENSFLSYGFNSANMLNFENYSSGIYVIKVITSSGVYSKRIIIR